MTEGEVASILGGLGKLTYNRSGQTNNGSTYFCKEWKGLIRGLHLERAERRRQPKDE